MDNSSPPTRALGYVRVSTTEQADSGAGLAAQQAAIEREAAHRGWDLAPILTETGSGRSLRGSACPG